MYIQEIYYTLVFILFIPTWMHLDNPCLTRIVLMNDSLLKTVGSPSVLDLPKHIPQRSIDIEVI